MDFGFKVGGSITFGFDVGGGSAPEPTPEPGGTNTIHGTFILDFGGHMVSPAPLCGTMTEEE